MEETDWLATSSCAKKWFVYKGGQARASESASSTGIDVLEILAGSWAEVSSPRKIACGATRPTRIILWQKLAFPLAGLKV